jgi:hypothetical protein
VQGKLASGLRERANELLDAKPWSDVR